MLSTWNRLHPANLVVTAFFTSAWIGGGDDANEAALKSAGVTITGWMPRANALEAMRGLDIYLHPSRWEGMPVALIEAQLCGLPAVASDVVGNRDVIVDR